VEGEHGLPHLTQKPPFCGAEPAATRVSSTLNCEHQISILCSCRNNQLYLVEAKHIVAVHAAPCPSEQFDANAAATIIRSALCEAVLLRWQLVARGQMTVAAGAGTATLAVALAAAHSKLHVARLLEGTGWLEAVSEAEDRLQARQAELAVVEAASCRSAGGESRRAAELLVAQANGLRAQITSLQVVAESSKAAEVSAVENIVEVLKLFGAVKAEEGSEGRFQLTPVGLIGRDIRFDNELWLALMLQDAGVLVRAARPCTPRPSLSLRPPADSLQATPIPW
jgi:hypothetical protein